MSLRFYANAPATTLTGGITGADLSIQVASIAGFPLSFPYTLILDRGEATEEVVEVTAGAGSTLTVTRGVDGTTAFSHSNAGSVVHGISARDLREPNSHINASTGVHGITGAVVGTTDAQALTNKDLTGAGNTFPTSLATLSTAQTLTNKTISADSNTISGLAASSFVLSNASGNVDGAAAQKVIPAGAVVGTTDTQTLTAKTLSVASNTINGLTASNFAVADGTGKLVGSAKAVPTGAVVGTSDTQTLTNKTLTAPIIDGRPINGAILNETVARASKAVDTASITTEALVLATGGIAVVAGAVYRVTVTCSPSNNTAAGFTTMRIRTDTVGTGITGTEIQNVIADHRQANRRQGAGFQGEFTAGASGTTFVKLTMASSNTSTDNGGTGPTLIYVERIA